MKGKRTQIILWIIIFILLCCYDSKEIYATESSKEVGEIYTTKINSEIEVDYDYHEDSNTVTATIHSKNPLKDTKPTWTLSDDQLSYTKTFASNIKYTTSVENNSGKVTNVTIEITQIKAAQINVEYEYNAETNMVTAKMISDIELKDTKPSWTLSEDKKVYTKIFGSNINYNTPVEDIAGNIINVNINVTKVKVAQIKVEYDYNDQTNMVTAKMISDIELKDTKPSWTLSEDQLTYTKVFGENSTYVTAVEDKYGNIITVTLKINQIDKAPPKITLEYKYNDDDTVTIYMKSNEELKHTKPSWTLSEDRKTYEKVFGKDEDYSTSIEDKYGNATNVKIKLKKKRCIYPKADGSTITVQYMYTSYDYVIVNIKSTEKIKDTKPSWILSEDGYVYTKIFYDDNHYTTQVEYENGLIKNVEINVDMFFKIQYETSTYGASGALLYGIAGGSYLEYDRFGNGPNVFFATFCLHGYEDSWDRDGAVLLDIAKNFYNRLLNDMDKSLAQKWTIYIIKEVNPDGRRIGTTNNGPGRTTVYSKVDKGIDINRSWQTDSYYKRYTDNRNYNGTGPYQAYEAEYLRDFLLSHKSTNGQNVLVDLHGWENQLIGDSAICDFYKQQYTSCSTKNYGNYGTQYLISWARQNLGAKTALVELPQAYNYNQVNSMGLSDKYINATLNMLRGL